MSEKTYYLAGKMSGEPQFNFPAFDGATRKLREQGYTIISPAELDDPEIRVKYLASADGSNLPDTPSWGTFLARDVKLVADECQGIILLPGWEKSRGAKLELYVAILCGHEIWQYRDDGKTLQYPAEYMKAFL